MYPSPPRSLPLHMQSPPLLSIFSTHLPKLVAGEAQYLKVGERLLQHIHVGVLVGVASVGGHVHNQHHLSAKKSIQHSELENNVALLVVISGRGIIIHPGNSQQINAML